MIAIVPWPRADRSTIRERQPTFGDEFAVRDGFAVRDQPFPSRPILGTQP
jgi:hypothetical protein